jgi:curved DNA-binding protein
MEFKDYYATLGVDAKASATLIKRAYRKLARKYHPDVSKEPDAENRFKEVAEAHEALIDPERRAAYDDLALRHAQAKAQGRSFEPPPGWDTGYEFTGRGGSGGGRTREADFSDFFESLFGRAAQRGPAGRGQAPQPAPLQGADHHARIEIDLQDAWQGATHTIALRRPGVDAQGRSTVQERQLEVHIPRGIRPGQQLRLAGQGEAGHGHAPAGDLYLEIEFRAHPLFRLQGADLWLDLPLAPWEAALGASVALPTPGGEVQLAVPANSSAGRKLRLRGRGLPGKLPGDLYAVLQVVLPAADSDAARAAYTALAQAFASFEPRPAATAHTP